MGVQVTMANSKGSITRWLDGLKRAEPRAVEEIWRVYFSRLAAQMRRKMADLPRRELDEEDVALSAMKSLTLGAAEEQFPQLAGRDDLWKLLLIIAGRKLNDYRKRLFAKKRAAGNLEAEVGPDGSLGLAAHPSPQMPPDWLAAMAETCQAMLAALGDHSLVLVAEGKLAGLTNDELAVELDCSPRTIGRKIERIRRKWTERPAVAEE